MGFELVYCWKCTKRLTEKDFANGKAFRVGIQTSCVLCVDELLAPLTPEQREAILNPRPADAPTPGGTTRTSRPASPRDMPAVPRRAPVPVSKGAPLALILGALAAVALVAVLLIAMKKPGSTPPPGPPSADPNAPRHSATPTPPPSTPPIDTLTPGLGKDSGFSVEPARDAAARAALQKARDHQKAKPDDIGTLAQLFEQAIWECEKTPYADEAKRGHAEALARLQTALKPALEALDAELRPSIDGERFQQALDQLEQSRKLNASPDWGRAIDRKAKEILDAAEGHFMRLKGKAQAARERSDKQEMQELRDTVKSWGITKYVDELERVLTGSP